MLSRIIRIFKHHWLADAQHTLPPTVLERLTSRVAGSEQHHSGEIRICVEAGLPLSYLWRDATARQRAVALFGKLQVWDTAHNNGVLIYLLLAERKIEIVADRGLNDKISTDTWHAVLARMRGTLKSGNFEAGLTSALEEVDAMLLAHFPLSVGETNPNELPDAPVLR